LSSHSIPKKKSVILGLAALAVLGALYWFFYERPLAVVGETKIYRKDAEYRDQVVRIYYPEEKRNMGLFQLVKSARNLEILRNHGKEFDAASVKAEYQRMLAESKDPKMLERIRAVFGKDEEGFLKNFVLPNLADHHIYYEFFLLDPGVQMESFNKANEFIKLVADTDSAQFKKLAEEKNIRVNGLTLSLKKGMRWDAERQMKEEALMNPREQKNSPRDRHGRNKGRRSQPPPRPERPPAMMDAKVAEYMNSDTIKDAEVWYDKLIKNMKPGDVFFEPVSVGETFVVIHYLQKISEDDHRLEAAFFPKQDYAQWYAKELTKVKTEIYDKSLIPKGLL